jgi:hypothetical protein
LNGKYEQSEKLFAVGEWLAKRKYVRGLIQFSKAVAAIGRHDFVGSREYLTKALALSPRQISEYCEFSVHIREAVKNDVAIARIVGTEGKAAKAHA